jgi:hypothetical protein
LISDTGPHDIQVIAGSSISQFVPHVISKLGRSLDCYIDAANITSMISALPHQDVVQQRSKGVKLRCITEITKDNLPHCIEMMKYFELYHAPLLRGNFVILDEEEYLGYAASEKGKDALISIRVPSFIAGQLFLFNNLAKNALPARQRIREIGKGSESEFMETIRDPQEIKALVLDLIGSAIYEISILFSNKKLFLTAEREGILDAIAKVSERGARVRILVMKDDADNASNTVLKIPKNIRMNYLQQFLPTKISTFIIDETKSLVLEVNDDTKDNFHEASGLAQYSNSESTVFSNTSMFESLWIQSELDKQNKTKQVYFQMFKGFKLKDEIYNRRWSFEHNEKSEKK